MVPPVVEQPLFPPRLSQSVEAHSGAVYGLAQRPDQKGAVRNPWAFVKQTAEFHDEYSLDI